MNRTLDPEAQERMFLAVGRAVWVLTFFAGIGATLAWQWLMAVFASWGW